MKSRLSITALALALSGLSVSCDKVKPPQPEITPPAPSGQAPAQPEQRASFMQEAQKELNELAQVIAKLKTRAQETGAQSKAKLLEEAQALEAGLTEAQQQLEKLKEATVESWHQMKDTYNRSLEKLKGAVKGASKDAT